MNRNFLTGQRLIAISLLGLLTLNYPLLTVVNRSETVFGIPVLYVYLFALWTAVILLCAWVVERS